MLETFFVRSAATALVLSTSIGAAQADTYFARAQNAYIAPTGLLVFQAASPPASISVDQPSYHYFPGNVFVSGNIAGLNASTDTSVSGGPWIWVNRSNSYVDPTGVTRLNATRKPNDAIYPIINFPNGTTQARPEYTTQANADAATQAFLAYAMCRPATNGGNGYLDYTRATGIPDANVISWMTAACDVASSSCTGTPASSPIYFKYNPTDGNNTSYQVSHDIVILPQSQQCTVASATMKTWLVLDYEVADGRTTTAAQNILTALTNQAHAQNYKVAIFADPLDSVTTYCTNATGGTTGCNVGGSGLTSANVPQIATGADQFWLNVSPLNAPVTSNMSSQDQAQVTINELATQAAIANGTPASHLGVGMGIGPDSGPQLTTAQAQAVNAVITVNGLGGIFIWRDYATPGLAQYYSDVGYATGILH